MTLSSNSSGSEGTSKVRLPDRAALAVISLLAFGWRVGGLTHQSLWRDEVDSLHFAARTPPELLATFARPGENGPLFFALLHPWLKLLGSSEFSLRLQASFGGMLAVMLTWALAVRLMRVTQPLKHDAERPAVSSALPLLAAALAAVNPYLVWYSQEGKMYGWLPALVLATLYAFLAALEQGGTMRWLLWLLLLGISVLHHIWAILLVPLCMLWLALLGPRYHRRWLPFLLTLLLPVLPYMRLVGWWQWRLWQTPNFQTGHPFVEPMQMLSGLATAYTMGLGVAPTRWPLIGLILLLLAGTLLPALRRNERIAPPLLWSWIVLPPLALYAISLSKPLYADRYVIWIVPGLTLLAAQSILVLSRTSRALGALALAAALLTGTAAGWRQMHTPLKSDFRAAAAYIEAQRAPGDRLLFQIPYNRIVYEYYAGPQTMLDGPYTNNDNPVTQIEAELAAAVGDAPAVWLIASEEALWDSRGLTRAWLETHGEITDQQGWARVEAVRYQLAATPAP